MVDRPLQDRSDGLRGGETGDILLRKLLDRRSADLTVDMSGHCGEGYGRCLSKWSPSSDFEGTLVVRHAPERINTGNWARN